MSTTEARRFALRGAFAWVFVVAAAVAHASEGKATDKPPEALTVAQLQAGKPVLGLTIGQSRAEVDTALAGRRTEKFGEDETLIWNAVSLDGNVGEQTIATFDAKGLLIAIRTTVNVGMPDGVARIMKLDDEICGPFGPIDRRYPMPPTPRPGDGPTPMQTELRCEGAAGTVVLTLIEKRVKAETTDYATVELYLQRKPAVTP